MGLLTTALHPLILRRTHPSAPLFLLPELQEEFLFIYNLRFSPYLQRLLKAETEMHFPGCNLGPSYQCPVQMEERGHSLLPEILSPRPFTAPCLSHPLLTGLLLQTLLATSPPLTSKAESPGEVSTEKREKERWEGQGRKLSCKPGEGSDLFPLHSVGKFYLEYDPSLLSGPHSFYSPWG